MCGIAGIIVPHGSDTFDRALRDMTNALTHRGPDGRGTLVRRHGRWDVGLGHTRLAIIDPSPAGKQPMEGAKKPCWLTYNGEVYNFRDLRTDLKAAGQEFRSRTDTEVVRALAARGYAVIVLGALGDRELCRTVSETIGDGARNLAGKTSLLEAASLLTRCDILISNDTGLQHLAAAVGTPCVSIFSFREFRGEWHPHGDGHVVLQKWVPCHTCLLEVCPYDNKCIKAVTVEDVLTAAAAKLAWDEDGMLAPGYVGATRSAGSGQARRVAPTEAGQ